MWHMFADADTATVFCGVMASMKAHHLTAMTQAHPLTMYGAASESSIPSLPCIMQDLVYAVSEHKKGV